MWEKKTTCGEPKMKKKYTGKLAKDYPRPAKSEEVARRGGDFQRKRQQVEPLCRR